MRFPCRTTCAGRDCESFNPQLLNHKLKTIIVRRMNKLIISILGDDRPGIIAAVSRVLFQQDCNIENVSQTILQSEFSAIFILSVPEGLTIDELNRHLNKKLSPLNLYFHVKKLSKNKENTAKPEDSEPFVITTIGPDRKGLVAEITKVIADYNVNVTNLKAVFKGGDVPGNNIMIYEVDIPITTNQNKFCTELRQKAQSLNLDVTIQHRNIFMALNRI